MSTRFNVWPFRKNQPGVMDLSITNSSKYTILQCELIDLLGQEGPTTWELGLDELVVHDDKTALVVALKWS